jgi:BirA family biotin operon repressor/biotin-[acetyl-CoA-carboxylase] ligase
LTFSLSLPMHPRDWSGLSLAVGQAIADALDPPGAGPVRIGLKWPNDLWILDTPGRGRKLGGILIETVAHGDQRTVVIGVGLNIRPLAPLADRSAHHSAERAPDDQPEAATLTHGLACLQELDPAATAPGALAALALPLVQALQRFEREGFAACQPAYARRDLLVGQPLTTLGGTQSLQGRSEGVGTDGALLLRCPDGTLARIVSGEVSVRLAAGTEAASATARPTPAPDAPGGAAC